MELLSISLPGDPLSDWAQGRSIDRELPKVPRGLELQSQGFAWTRGLNPGGASTPPRDVVKRPVRRWGGMEKMLVCRPCFELYGSSSANLRNDETGQQHEGRGFTPSGRFLGVVKTHERTAKHRIVKPCFCCWSWEHCHLCLHLGGHLPADGPLTSLLTREHSCYTQGFWTGRRAFLRRNRYSFCFLLVLKALNSKHVINNIPSVY